MSDAPQAIAEPIVLFPRAAHFALTQRLMPLVSKWAEAPVVDDPAPGAREPDACFVTPRRAVAEFDRILVDLAMAKLLPAYEPGWVSGRLDAETKRLLFGLTTDAPPWFARWWTR